MFGSVGGWFSSTSEGADKLYVRSRRGNASFNFIASRGAVFSDVGRAARDPRANRAEIVCRFSED